MNAPDIYKQFSQGLDPNPLNDLAIPCACTAGTSSRRSWPTSTAPTGAWPTTSNAVATKP